MVSYGLDFLRTSVLFFLLSVQKQTVKPPCEMLFINVVLVHDVIYKRDGFSQNCNAACLQSTKTKPWSFPSCELALIEAPRLMIKYKLIKF